MNDAVEQELADATKAWSAANWSNPSESLKDLGKIGIRYVEALKAAGQAVPAGLEALAKGWANG